MNFRTRFLVFSALTFFAVELVARILDFYAKYTYYDDISHLLFGVSLYAIFKLTTRFRIEAILFFYTIIALFWEFIEKIGDVLIDQPSYQLDFFYFDGVFDVLFGYIGIFLIHYYYQSRVK